MFVAKEGKQHSNEIWPRASLEPNGVVETAVSYS
jgi:hypothetical protein